MSKLQEIHNALVQVNPAAFQNLCDAFLAATEPGNVRINSNGSQKGKQKTTKGTPDSYYRLPSGKYVFIEYTTKDKKDNPADFFRKAKEDIDKCVHEKKTKIKRSQIARIIYCCNSSFAPGEEEQLVQHSAQYRIRLDLHTLDTISYDLLNRCAHIAEEFLGVSMDTAQILTPNTFIEEYESSGFATKLSNQFFPRESEEEKLRHSVTENRITVVTGPAGMGKTRLVLALLEQLRKEDKTLTCYCISNKVAPLYNDLRTYLDKRKKYLLFIDDANKQTNNLDTILSILGEKRTGQLRVIITVRDYAIRHLTEGLAAYTPSFVPIDKLSDDQLTEILKSNDFKIRNPTFIKRILALADGNPRLALMAAKVARDNDSMSALHDASDIYEQYFKNTVSSEVFDNQTTLKVMGLMSFFHSVDSLDAAWWQQLEKLFGIDRLTFLQAAHQLERLEMLDSSHNGRLIKVSEQVLRTYFFYNTFFKTRLLDFGIILKEYFSKYKWRIQESVIPANNTFGYEKLHEDLLPLLTEEWSRVKNDELAALDFLDLFWFHLLDETLWLVDRHIEQCPIASHQEFIYDDKSVNAGSYNKNPYLGLLTNFYTHAMNELPHAIDLAIALVQRQPEAFTQCCAGFKDSFVFRWEDVPNDFWRQNVLIDHTLQQSPDLLLTPRIFQTVMPSLMKYHPRVMSGGRDRNSFGWYDYDVPLTKGVKHFRSRVWQFFASHLIHDEPSTEKFLLAILQNNPAKEKTVVQFDLKCLLPLINKYFKTSSLVHCYLVHELIWWCGVHKITHRSLSVLEKKFWNPAYWTYTRLVPDRYQGSYKKAHQLSFSKIDKLKDAEVRESFLFDTAEPFKDFLLTFTALERWIASKKQTLVYALDKVIHENDTRHPEVTFEVIQWLILEGNSQAYVPQLYLSSLVQREKQFQQVFEIVQSHEFLEKEQWLMGMLSRMPKHAIKHAHVKALLQLYASPSQNYWINVAAYEAFYQKKKTLLPRLLTIIHTANTTGPSRLTIDNNFFESYTSRLSAHIPLLKKTYLQQEAIGDHHDHDFKDFLGIVRLDADFLVEYLTYCSADAGWSFREYVGLSAIWELDNAEDLVWDAMNFLTAKRRFNFREDFSNAFFTQMKKIHELRAYALLLKYITTNATDPVKVNATFDCVRHCFRERLEEFLHAFLKINPDVEIFKRIGWTTNRVITGRQTSIDDLRAEEYQMILDMLDLIKDKPFRYAEHKAHLKLMISHCRNSAENDRLRNFLFED